MGGELAFDRRIRRSLDDCSAVIGGGPLWLVLLGLRDLSILGWVVILMVKYDCLPFLLTKTGERLIFFKTLFRAIEKGLKGKDEENSRNFRD